MRTLLAFLPAFAIMGCVTMPPSAGGQAPDSKLAHCPELNDAARALSVQMCATHAGCKMVLDSRKSCASAKDFLDNLASIVARESGEANARSKDASPKDQLKSLFSTKPRVTSNQVHDAALSNEVRAAISNIPAWKKMSAQVRDAVDKADHGVLAGANNGGSWVYVGDTKNGQASGWGATFWSDGEIQRGRFESSSLNGGPTEVLFPSGLSKVGTWAWGKQRGEGLALSPAGMRYEGGFQDDKPSGQGAWHRKDGSLSERGIYKDGQLSVGEKFDAQGNVIATIDQPREEREKARRAAEEKRVAEERGLAEARANARAVQIRQQLRQANESRRPVRSPNLEALLQQTIGARK